MAQVIPPLWKTDLTSLSFNSEAFPGTNLMMGSSDHTLPLDVSHFGSRLSIEDVVLGETKPQGKIDIGAEDMAMDQGKSPGAEDASSPTWEEEVQSSLQIVISMQNIKPPYSSRYVYLAALL